MVQCCYTCQAIRRAFEPPVLLLFKSTVLGTVNTLKVDRLVGLRNGTSSSARMSCNPANSTVLEVCESQFELQERRRSAASITKSSAASITKRPELQLLRQRHKCLVHDGMAML